MKNLLKELSQKITQISNRFQYAAFISFGCLIVILFLHDVFLIRIIAVLAILTSLIFVEPLFTTIFDYLKSRNRNKETFGWMKVQDPNKSPANIAASGIERNAGKNMAYNHVLKEIKELRQNDKNEKQILASLEERIKGAINSLTN